MTCKTVWVAVPVHIEGIVGHTQVHALALEAVQQRRAHYGKTYVAGLTTVKGSARVNYKGAKPAKECPKCFAADHVGPCREEDKP